MERWGPCARRAPCLPGRLFCRDGSGCGAAGCRHPEHPRLHTRRAVYVNGIGIGRATEETVELVERDGRIEAKNGLDTKPHGLEKLHRNGVAGISTAWCKSGAVRSRTAAAGERAPRQGRIVVIDHCGHTIYRELGPDCCGVLAVGDDTTAVCGHICLHRGIPVLGITDLDRDGILPSAFAPGSVILDTRPERDDDVGAEVGRRVPEGPSDWDDWVQAIIGHLGNRAKIVLDLREARP